MLRSRKPPSGRSLKYTRRDEVPSLDLSGGQAGVLHQVLPIVCCPTGQSKTRRLAFLNAAVRALQQLHKQESVPEKLIEQGNELGGQQLEGYCGKTVNVKSNSISPEGNRTKNTPSDGKKEKQEEDNLEKCQQLEKSTGDITNFLSDVTDKNYPESQEQLNVQRVNELNIESTKLGIRNTGDEYITPKKDKKGMSSSIIPSKDYNNISNKDFNHLDSEPSATVNNGTNCSTITKSSLTESKESPSKLQTLQHTNNDGLDFREELYTMEEYFCMLRCCLVCDGQEVRAAGLRLLRYLLHSNSDASALCCSNIVPLIIRCLDTVGGSNSSERLQALRLLRKLLQVSSSGPDDGEASSCSTTSSSPRFPAGLLYSVVAMVRTGLHCKDGFLYPALAVLTELVIAQPAVTLSCGAMAALQNNLLECSSVPRIHESLLASLLRLANSPQHRHHTTHLLQIVAPYTDYHYRHTPHELKHISTSEERELRLSSARLCMLVLLRSWPGLLLITRNNLAALRCITAHLAHSPHPSSSTAIINLLYEVFSIRESRYFNNDGSQSEVAVTSSSGGGKAGKRPRYTLQGGSSECQEWDAVVAEHLRTPSLDPEAWSLYEGFVAAEAKSSLPHLARCRPNLVQGQQSLVLFALIKADLLAALCHVVINSAMPLALRTTILLGELVHRAHQDLPVECSQLTHALPELMNQAATNYSLVSTSATTTTTNSTTNRLGTSTAGLPPNLHHSSNPAVNDVDLNHLTEVVFSDERSGKNRDSVGSGGGGDRNSKSITNLHQQALTTGGVDGNSISGSSSNLFTKLRQLGLEPTNPYSIPSKTSITNAATKDMTQPQRRARASLAIGALLKLSRGRLNPPALPPQHSLYLAHLLHALPYAGSPTTTIGGGALGTGGGGGRGSLGDTSTVQLQQVYLRKRMVVTPANDMTKMSKWLSGGSEQEELVQRTLKRCHVMKLGHDQHKWQWDLIMALLRWPSEQLQRINSATYRLFVRRIVHFYKPSAEQFSVTSIHHHKARQEAETLMLLVHFLLLVPENDPGRYLEELLLDVMEHLKLITVKHPGHEYLLSPGALNTTCSHYYFLMLGVLSRSARGHNMLTQAGLLEQLHLIVTKTSNDIYIKLIASSLDYTIDGLNRGILHYILNDSDMSESSRVYGTSLLRALLRSQTCPHTLRWTLQLLVRQLFNTSVQVCLLALSILYEVTEVPHILASLVRAPPLLPQSLGPHAQLLTARMLQAPLSFATYDRCGLVDRVLALWDHSFNVKYVQLQESALCEALTQHRRDEKGRYGRRSSSAVLSVEDVYALPHLYGALVQHKDGLSKLLAHPQLDTLVQTVKVGNMSSSREVTLLKAAVWAVCHGASSTAGLSHLATRGALHAVVQLAATATVYSLRGTCYMALSLVATTHAGVMVLREHGWESVVRDHHQRWQSNLHPMYDPSQHQQLYQQQQLFQQQQQNVLKQRPASFAAPYCTALSEDNYIGLSPKAPAFFMAGDSEDDYDEEEEEEDEIGEESDEGASFVVEGIGLDAPFPPAPHHRKAQTLPNKGRTPCSVGHQRSLSDCAPVPEETSSCALSCAATATAASGAGDLNSSSTCNTPHHHHQQQQQQGTTGGAGSGGGTAKGMLRRGSLRLNKILSSMKKRTDRRRRDSDHSTASSDKSRPCRHHHHLNIDSYNQQYCCDSSPSPRILDTPTPPPMNLPHSPTVHHPSSPFFPTSPPPALPGSPHALPYQQRCQQHCPRCFSATSPPLQPLPGVSVQPQQQQQQQCSHCRRRQSLATSSSGGASSSSPPLTCSLASSRRESLDSSRCIYNKVDVAVQLSPIASGGSLSVGGSIAGSELRDDTTVSVSSSSCTPQAPCTAPSADGSALRPSQDSPPTAGSCLSNIRHTSSQTYYSSQGSLENSSNAVTRGATRSSISDSQTGEHISNVHHHHHSNKHQQQLPQQQQLGVLMPLDPYTSTTSCTCYVRKVSSPGLTLPGLVSNSPGHYDNSAAGFPGYGAGGVCCSLPGGAAGAAAGGGGAVTSSCPKCGGGSGAGTNRAAGGIPHNASQSSMVSVPSRVSLIGCQVLLAISEQRRAESESQQQLDQKKRDYLTTLLSDCYDHPSLNYSRGSTSDGRSCFPRTASGISRISSSGSLVPHVHSLGLAATLSPPHSFSNGGVGGGYSFTDTGAHYSYSSTGTTASNKFTDAKYSSSMDNYIISGEEGGAGVGNRGSDRYGSSSSPPLGCICGKAGTIGSSDNRTNSCFCGAGYGGASAAVRGTSDRVWGHKAVVAASCGPRYIGLCMPLDLQLLLNTDGHWDKASDWLERIAETHSASADGHTDEVEDVAENGDEKRRSQDSDTLTENGDGSEETVINDKDKWRESREGEAMTRLETVREESFNSGDGTSSLHSVSFSTTMDSGRTATTTVASTLVTLTSDRTVTTSSNSQSITGLTLHSKQSCLGCFSLCQRQEIAQPTEQVSGDVAAAAAGVSALLAGLRPPNLEDASRPETPVDKWEGLVGLTSSCASGRAEETRVLVRKDVVRFIINMANPFNRRDSESGLLSLKQRYPDTFRDVCLYSEVYLLLSSIPYSLSARQFIQEMFADVPFKEVFEEAECLLRRLDACRPPVDAASPAITPQHGWGAAAASRRVHNKLNSSKKMMNSDARQAGRQLLPDQEEGSSRGEGSHSGGLDESLFIKEDLPEAERETDPFEGFDRLDNEKDADDSEKDADLNSESLLSRGSNSNCTTTTTTTSDGGAASSDTTLPASDRVSASAAAGGAAVPYVTLSTANDDGAAPVAPDDKCAIADGRIVLLTRQLTESSGAGADLTLSDYEGLSTDDEDCN